VAGIADAIGFITMGGVFAANMTGNTVLAGIAAAQGHWLSAGNHLATLAAFFAGAMLARLLLRLWHRPAVPILIEAAIVGGLGFLPLGVETAVLILAFAMGVQASAITSFGGISASTVVITSTLARTAEASLDALVPANRGKLPSVASPSLLALSWSGYLVGAVAGALLLHVLAWPLIVPAVLLLGVAALCGVTSAA
jgi:uncharacterized membrane protein YoaK (UPF0700 family)